MKVLATSDLHRDLRTARALVEKSRSVDAGVIAGDLATARRGLKEIVDVLSAIDTPTVIVPGNSETDVELRDACRGWPEANVLHGGSVRIGGVEFFGLGAAVPITPFGAWSFDLSEEEAARLLLKCPEGAVLVSHSPPYGCCDRDSGGRHLGSRSILKTVTEKKPQLVICGHIHGDWGERSEIGGTPIVNAGPEGVVVEVS